MTNLILETCGASFVMFCFVMLCCNFNLKKYKTKNLMNFFQIYYYPLLCHYKDMHVSNNI